MNLNRLFELAAERHASDIHLATAETPRLRIGGDLVPLEEAIDLSSLLEPLLNPEGRARLGMGLAVERTLIQGELAFVALVFRVGEGDLAATFRILRKDIPSFDVVAEGAESFLRGIVKRTRGLVLVTGPTGSGKWTTACALVETINAERPARIFVINAHADYLFESKLGMVTQLSAGEGQDGILAALRIAGRSDPDVIAMDDVPTLETFRQALVLADTGHLVIANLHAESAVGAVERLLQSAGDEAPALRRALAENLIAVTSQRLVSRSDRKGRVPLYEWIANTPAIRTALMEGDLAEAQGRDPECRTSAAALEKLVADGKVAPR